MTKGKNKKKSQKAATSSGSDNSQKASERSILSRFESFCKISESVQKHAVVTLPQHLQDANRRLHVRQTLREDHEYRIAAGREGGKDKFDKLADSLYDFFRGTALLFYRDMAGTDSSAPTVLALGDVHPGNFGVMPNRDNVPIFGVNDFDDADYAPFTWDLKRGAVGFMLAGMVKAGYSRKRSCKIAKYFLKGYVDGVKMFAKNSGESEQEMRQDNAPKLIRQLIEDAKCSRAEWLADDYLNESKRGFKANDELVPISSRRDEFQTLLDQTVRENDITVPSRAGQLRIKDVAVRHGQGTASLGLPRFYVLVEGPAADGTDDLILEFKRARQSAMAGLAPTSSYQTNSSGGQRIAHAQAVQLARGDVFYGAAEIDGQSFMLRERAPFRDDIDMDDLSKGEWKEYARICGYTLAHTHALSDEKGRVDNDIEPLILEAIEPKKLFFDDILRFADEASRRMDLDHQAFCQDHHQGAFQKIDIIYK